MFYKNRTYFMFFFILGLTITFLTHFLTLTNPEVIIWITFLGLIIIFRLKHLNTVIGMLENVRNITYLRICEQFKLYIYDCKVASKEKQDTMALNSVLFSGIFALSFENFLVGAKKHTTRNHK